MINTIRVSIGKNASKIILMIQNFDITITMTNNMNISDLVKGL